MTSLPLKGSEKSSHCHHHHKDKHCHGKKKHIVHQHIPSKPKGKNTIRLLRTLRMKDPDDPEKNPSDMPSDEPHHNPDDDEEPCDGDDYDDDELCDDEEEEEKYQKEKEKEENEDKHDQLDSVRKHRHKRKVRKINTSQDQEVLVNTFQKRYVAHAKILIWKICNNCI